MRWALRVVGVLLVAAQTALMPYFLRADEPPRPLDRRLKIELFAEQPQIVTPTGIDVDHAGRVWVIESNTHFRPDNYEGHPSDRVLVMRDTDGDHRADEIVTFADGFTHAMSVAVKPVWLDHRLHQPEAPAPGSSSNVDHAPGARASGLSVFLATRAALWLCRDTDGDLKCDERTRLVRLETPGNYPHNGLAGFAFDPLGWMYFGFGENLGAEYKIVGSDGTTLSGGGEGGNLYRCRPDGSQLERWATGFWNPHASCFDAFGRLFTVDNDPDSRPPCRLLHIIPGGDYGYRFRNGRKGTHPFTSWNGEIPGTLPMVAGTGEAPSGIVAYESDSLPDDYLGTLLVTSWGDHRIDKFVLKPKGASFTSKAEPIIQGGETFRPVGLALAPDGSLYCTDWVLKDYKLHGKGRVWRISAAKEPTREVIDVETVRTATAAESLRKHLQSPRTEVRRVAARKLAWMPEQKDYLRKILTDDAASTRTRVETLWAISQIPPDQIDFQLASTKDRESAPLGGRFDEMIVAAVPLVGEGQFRCADPYGREIYESWSLIQSATLENAAAHILDQFRLWQNLREDRRGSLELVNDLFDANVDTSTSVMIEFNDWGDPFQFCAEIIRDVRSAEGDALVTSMAQWVWFSNHTRFASTEVTRTQALLATRQAPADDSNRAVLRLGLTDESPAVRRAAVQWVGEEHLTEYRWLVEGILNEKPMTSDLFLACLATLSLLDGVPPAEFEKTPPAQYILQIVKDEAKPPALRAQALRMLSPNETSLDANLLGELLAAGDPILKLEAVRTLQHSPIPEREELLRPIAADEELEVNLRAEAIVGLASAEMADATRALLTRFARSENAVIREEAQRSLRGPVNETAGLRLRLVEEYMTGGDAQAGRRVFYHANSAGCYKCHTINGRGGQVGPDLSVIARTMDRQKLAESILEPSKEISPQYTTWTIATQDGQVHTGLILAENPDGTLRLGNAEGNVLTLQEADIETREPQKVSLMPEKLIERLMPDEFRDLLAFLETLK